MNKKNKKIYSKIKQPVIISETPIENAIQLIEKVNRVKNIWSEFIDKAIYKEEEIPNSYENDLRNIFKHIEDRRVKRKIINSLMQNKTYNPFTDKIPLDSLPDNYRNLVNKIQRKLLENNNFASDEIKQGINTLQYNNNYYTYIITEKKEENFNKELYAQGINIVILYDKEEKDLLVVSDPKLTNRPDFTCLYNELEKKEATVWYLHGTKGMIMNKYNMYTLLNPEDIVNLINECNNK